MISLCSLSLHIFSCFPEPHAVVSQTHKETLFFQFQDLLLYPNKSITHDYYDNTVRAFQKYVHNPITDRRDLVNWDNIIIIRSDKNPICGKCLSVIHKKYFLMQGLILILIFCDM